jgi:hypothetical protein
MTTSRVATSKKIKFAIKLTYTKSDNLYLQIDVNIYHTKEEEVELKVYIKHTLGVTEEINSTDPLMKNHVCIQQFISDMNNARSRDPFQYTQLHGYHLLEKVSFWMMYDLDMQKMSVRDFSNLR